ncbi:MAG TPA: tripartite tricarboxylate transporter substrate-binding protein, partial [Burkholderiaceae bacterium]|nr:tripartite tricarboxylate transporter substrate-binding protein [Burkholderiaceae bacterium]
RLEDVPTVKELGLPELTDIVGWSAIVGPPDMDQSVIDVLEKGMQDVKDDEEWIAFTEKVGSVSDIRSPEETREFVAAQRKIYRDMVERLSIKGQ